MCYTIWRLCFFQEDPNVFDIKKRLLHHSSPNKKVMHFCCTTSTIISISYQNVRFVLQQNIFEIRKQRKFHQIIRLLGALYPWISLFNVMLERILP